MPTRVLPALLLVLAACQSGGGGDAASVPPEYKRDIERVCDVIARSGADYDNPETSPILVMAEWLAANLETEQGHEFLVAFQQTPDGDKSAKLLTEAKRVGLRGCALAAKWQPPPAG